MRRYVWIAALLSSLGLLLPAFPAGEEIEMVSVPGGTFEMGSAVDKPDEQPVHTVTVKAFSVSRTEVTVGQWRRFAEETGYRSEAEGGEGAYVWNGQKYEMKKGVTWKDPGFAQTDLHPVTCVSWNDSQEFIKWLNRKTGRRYRLPTEAEWEYACRAGMTGPKPADIEATSWYKDNSAQSTQPVGRKQENGFKLCDMLGGVWEWCQDWEGTYPSSPQVDPAGPAQGTKRIARGGGWLSLAEYIRASIRVGAPPNLRAVDLGFRLASD